jgi:hypothetical protein
MPEPCACTEYLYVPYKGHVIGTGKTETMEVSDSLRKDSEAGMKRIQSRKEKNPNQARKETKAGLKRLQGRQEKTQRQPRKDSKAGNKRLKGRSSSYHGTPKLGVLIT